MFFVTDWLLVSLVALIGAMGWLARHWRRRSAALAAKLAAHQSHELSLVHEIHHLRHPRISVSLRELNRFKGQLRREMGAGSPKPSNGTTKAGSPERRSTE